jgi:hypothetical protein
MRDDELVDYLLDHYGRCRVAPCQCLRLDRWPGCACPNWVPCGARSWSELAELQSSAMMRLQQSNTAAEAAQIDFRPRALPGSHEGRNASARAFRRGRAKSRSQGFCGPPILTLPPVRNERAAGG